MPTEVSEAPLTATGSKGGPARSGPGRRLGLWFLVRLILAWGSRLAASAGLRPSEIIVIHLGRLRRGSRRPLLDRRRQGRVERIVRLVAGLDVAVRDPCHPLPGLPRGCDFARGRFRASDVMSNRNHREPIPPCIWRIESRIEGEVWVPDEDGGCDGRYRSAW